MHCDMFILYFCPMFATYVGDFIFFRILVGKVLYESTFLLSRLLISLKIPSNVTSEN